MKKILLFIFLVLSVLFLSGKIIIKPDAFHYHLGEVLLYGGISEDYVISGKVLFKESGIPVQAGYVKALKYDWDKDMILVVDSSVISLDGYYRLNKARKDSLFIMAYSDDEEDFPPGYHDTSINWQTSRRVIASSSVYDVNVWVDPIIKHTGVPHSVGGRILKDPHNQNELIKGAVIYAKFGNEFKGYCISDENGHYFIDSLPFGDIELVAVRIGYYTDYRVVQVGEFNMDTIDFYLSKVSSVNIPKEKIPVEYSLSQNTPNPFNPVTKIKFDLPKSNLSLSETNGLRVQLVIYDVIGREVATLLNQRLNPGTYEVEWDGTNYPSGVYFYKLITGEVTLTRKMILVK
jgi:hypothetical protein